MVQKIIFQSLAQDNKNFSSHKINKIVTPSIFAENYLKYTLWQIPNASVLQFFFQELFTVGKRSQVVIVCSTLIDWYFCCRGGKELEDIGLETYGLSDLEEDEEYSNPGKLFDGSVHTYTYTTSTVLHPDDGTFVTPSNMGSRIASVCSSIQNSPPQTPMAMSRRNSCSTFSTTVGLAKMLNERGKQNNSLLKCGNETYLWRILIFQASRL